MKSAYCAMKGVDWQIIHMVFICYKTSGTQTVREVGRRFSPSRAGARSPTPARCGSPSPRQRPTTSSLVKLSFSSSTLNSCTTT